MLTRQATHLELMVSVLDHLSSRKQWIYGSEQLLRGKVSDPIHDNLANVVSDREEPCREGLGELGAHLPRILFHLVPEDVDVLELQ